MSMIEKMTEAEFEKAFGLSPERCRELLERVREIVNNEVHEAIEHADWYINPFDYCDKEYLEHHFGAIEKDDDADGYSCLYDYGRQYSAVSAFMDLISWHTSHGGHTSAIRACDLMGLEWEKDR